MSALMSPNARPMSVGNEFEKLLRAWRETADAQITPEHHDRQVHAAEQVVDVVIGRREVGIVVLQFLVDGRQFLVRRLQFLLRRFEFLVRALQLLVARLDFLIRRTQFLVRRLVLLGKRLQVLLHRRQFVRELRAPRILASAYFRRHGAGAAATVPRRR